jgi:hypothetical protein
MIDFPPSRLIVTAGNRSSINGGLQRNLTIIFAHLIGAQIVVISRRPSRSMEWPTASLSRRTGSTSAVRPALMAWTASPRRPYDWGSA